MYLVTFRRGRGEPKPGAVWHEAVLDLGVELGIVEKRGSFYLYKDERLAQGQTAEGLEDLRQAVEVSPREQLHVFGKELVINIIQLPNPVFSIGKSLQNVILG